MYALHDDIVALATIPGKSALNIIRLSGENVGLIYKRITKKTQLPKPSFAHPSPIYNHVSKRQIDFSLLTYFKKPKSYTGENLLEISTHGGSVIAKLVIETIINAGARQALPGEFTYRAYINGKVDLIQAEAISSIVQANNSIDSYYHLNAINGSLTNDIKKNKKELMNLIVYSEHELDFLDEEIDKRSFNEYISQLEKIYKNADKIIKQSLSEAQQKGNMKVVIIGKPNAGKSTLFNYITGQEKSIITNIRGTTRDSIESDVLIDESEVTIIDTAGLRLTNNIVEKKGIEKTYKHIKSSDIIIIIDEKDSKKTYTKHKKSFDRQDIVLVNNKSDINNHPKNGAFSISCKKRRGLDALLTHLSTLCRQKINIIYKDQAFSLNVRQRGLLKKICAGIQASIKILKETEDLAICINSLYQVQSLYNELIYPDPKNKIINKIFEGFCVGK